MKTVTHPSLRSLVAAGNPLRIAGAHTALGAVLAQEAGFDAAWASSFEISAARCLPDASLLTMTEYLEAAAHMQQACGIPVVADCDSGFGNNLNIAHMVHQYEMAGITAVAVEDKLYPKMNSFADVQHTLVEKSVFARKLEVAKRSQQTDDFFVIARTEALIQGMGVREALERCTAYVDSGADAVLVHSKKKTNAEVLEFLASWGNRAPVVVVPTTYPDWHIDDAAKAGVSAVIYANQGLRATITALRGTLGSIYRHGSTTSIENDVASVQDIFALQNLNEWQGLEA